MMVPAPAWRSSQRQWVRRRHLAEALVAGGYASGVWCGRRATGAGSTVSASRTQPARWRCRVVAARGGWRRLVFHSRPSPPRPGKPTTTASIRWRPAAGGRDGRPAGPPRVLFESRGRRSRARGRPLTEADRRPDRNPTASRSCARSSRAERRPAGRGRTAVGRLRAARARHPRRVSPRRTRARDPDRSAWAAIGDGTRRGPRARTHRVRPERDGERCVLITAGNIRGTTS